MNKKIFLIIILLILIFSSFFIIYNSVSYDTKKLDIYLTVGNYTGFNVDTDAIYFGTIMPSGIGTKIINIANLNQTSIINIKVYGGLKGWIYVSENNFILKPNEDRTLEIIVRIPENAKYKDYKGTLKIRFKKQI
ncbi:MAG: hypothetical protein KJ623_01525 [Nanoarchaeota archaeon]|nr:hypothetical protein [Nanoarchaeota archaeon]MBU0962850.1 hypothetical protein [Nanoarchaeota archaeon]